MNSSFDYVLVGGGLANGLLALALFSERPDVRIALVEAGATLGGDHLWCFHGGDIPPLAVAWVRPLVATSWDRWRSRR
jgi:lycopene beta-cyclase